jgi:hypothetical protein
MFLTDSDIDAILNDKPHRASSSKNRMFVNGEWVTGIKRNAETLGAYEGKTGSKRRSRKGRVWTMPNGRRYYNDLDTVVQAYRA